MADTIYYTSWDYRKVCTISNTDSELTDIYVKILWDTATLISAGKMQANCADVLVCLSNDPTPLYRFLEPDTENTANTAFFVKIPTLPNGDTKVYFYYGNSDVTDESETYNFGPFQTPIESHEQLENLDYANSGHTGFQPLDWDFTEIDDTDSPYTDDDDYYLSVDCSNDVVEYLLPAISKSGVVRRIKDATGSANTNNITITPNGSDTVERSADYTMSVNDECLTLISNNTTKNWEIVCRS